MPHFNLLLIDAAESGDLAGVQAAVAAGADIHAEEGEALYVAAELCHTAVVEWLLSVGADPLANNSYAMQRAAKNGGLAVVKILLAAGADIHADDELALRWAAEYGHADVVQYLLDAGADVDVRDDEDAASALYLASLHGHLDVAQRLLAAGAAVVADDVLVAALREHHVIIQLLRPHCSDIFGSQWKISDCPPAMQAAILETGDVSALSALDLARRGVCPEALCTLISRQGRAELAATLKATQMLKPLTPDERAELLENLLAKPSQRELAYVGP